MSPTNRDMNDQDIEKNRVKDEELELLQQRKLVEEEKIKVLQQLH